MSSYPRVECQCSSVLCNRHGENNMPTAWIFWNTEMRRFWFDSCPAYFDALLDYINCTCTLGNLPYSTGHEISRVKQNLIHGPVPLSLVYSHLGMYCLYRSFIVNLILLESHRRTCGWAGRFNQWCYQSNWYVFWFSFFFLLVDGHCIVWVRRMMIRRVSTCWRSTLQIDHKDSHLLSRSRYLDYCQCILRRVAESIGTLAGQTQ